jgi:hypothetical protein
MISESEMDSNYPYMLRIKISSEVLHQAYPGEPSGGTPELIHLHRDPALITDQVTFPDESTHFQPI